MQESHDCYRGARTTPRSTLVDISADHAWLAFELVAFFSVSSFDLHHPML